MTDEEKGRGESWDWRDQITDAIGSLKSDIRALRDAISQMSGGIDARHTENRASLEDVRREVHRIKHDQANAQTAASIQFSKFERSSAITGQKIDSMMERVNKMEGPVHEMQARWTRVGAIGVAVASILSAAGFFVSPFLKVIVDDTVRWLFGRG